MYNNKLKDDTDRYASSKDDGYRGRMHHGGGRPYRSFKYGQQKYSNHSDSEEVNSTLITEEIPDEKSSHSRYRSSKPFDDSVSRTTDGWRPNDFYQQRKWRNHNWQKASPDFSDSKRKSNRSPSPNRPNYHKMRNNESWANKKMSNGYYDNWNNKEDNNWNRSKKSSSSVHSRKSDYYGNNNNDDNGRLKFVKNNNDEKSSLSSEYYKRRDKWSPPDNHGKRNYDRYWKRDGVDEYPSEYKRSSGDRRCEDDDAKWSKKVPATAGSLKVPSNVRKSSLESADCDKKSSNVAVGGQKKSCADEAINEAAESEKSPPAEVSDSIKETEQQPAESKPVDDDVDEEAITRRHQEDEAKAAEERERKEIEELENYVKEMESKLKWKEESRCKYQNLFYHQQQQKQNNQQSGSDATSHQQAQDSEKPRDSSLKKNTAFVRKLRNFSQAQYDSLLSEMVTLNLEKYISEVVSALLESRFKLTDVASAVKLCAAIHENYYPDFAKVLYEYWQKRFTIVKKEEKTKSNPKLRVELRFYSELLTSGIIPAKEGFNLLRNFLTNLVYSDRENHANAAVLLSFCRLSAADYVDIVPKRIREFAQKYGYQERLEAIRKSLPTTLFERQSSIRTLLYEYYESVCYHMLKEREQLKEIERQNRKILQTKGQLNNEHKEKLQTILASFQKLHSTMESFSEALDQPMPSIMDSANNDDGDEDDESKKDTVLQTDPEVNDDAVDGGDIWEQEETKKFYEDIPSAGEYLPTADSSKKREAAAAAAAAAATTTATTTAADESGTVVNGKLNLDNFLNHLPSCVNKERIDNAAIEFLMNYNSKSNRRRITKALFTVPRTRLDLLPFYARFAAILYPVMPDVANELCASLKTEFKDLIQKKDQINIETKIKVVRFIGELVKFRLFPRSDGIQCLKELLNDFTHHHVEMACNLLETAGRFLYHSPDTRHLMKVYLEQMMRKKQVVLNLDWRYSNMIENAYYYVNPPDVARQIVQRKTALEAFLSKLLFHDLNADEEQTEEKVLTFMRKLDWNDKSTKHLAASYLSQAWKVKYFDITALAILLADLVKYEDYIGTEVVDNVMEDIELGLELNSMKMNQRRVATIKYLGELYNYRLVSNTEIFRVLYLLIMYGVVYDPSYGTVSPFDPPRSTIRLRLVCALLETCGHYFNEGLSRNKLDVYLLYFKHYYAFKLNNPIWSREGCSFPVEIKHYVEDTLRMLRPNIKVTENYQKASKTVQRYQRVILRQLQLLHSANENSSNASAGENSGNPAYGCYPDESVADSKNSGQLNVGNGIVQNSMSDQDDCYADEQRLQSLNEEDTDFVDAFDKMVNITIKERLSEQVKPQVGTISVPYNVRLHANKKTAYDHHLINNSSTGGGGNTSGNNNAANNCSPGDLDEMSFMLILRKGNKQQYKNLKVPLDSDLAKNLQSQKEEQRIEIQKVKRLTLDINERLEEEDYKQELSSTSSLSANNNNSANNTAYFCRNTQLSHHVHDKQWKNAKSSVNIDNLNLIINKKYKHVK